MHRHRRKRRSSKYSKAFVPISRYRYRNSGLYWSRNQVIGNTVVYGSSSSTSPNYWTVLSQTPHKVSDVSADRCFIYSKSCRDEIHKGPPYLSGGPLDLRTCNSNELELEPLEIGFYRPVNTRYAYWGGWYCIREPDEIWSNPINLTDDTFIDFDSALDYGARGWNLSRPGRPGADLGVFLAEIKDVPRTLRQTALFFRDSYRSFMSGVSKTTKHAADSWLAANFGWLPFVSDMRKFARVTQNLDKSIQQLRRDNGKWVRRARTVDASTEIVSDTGWVNNIIHHSPLLNTYFMAGTPNARGQQIVERLARFWFEASFRYWIPDIGTNKWEKKAIRKLYGLSLTPEVLWEATPFSWLVDWLSNAGDLISNLDNNLAENLVAKYAYVMGSQKILVTYKTDFNHKPGIPKLFVSSFSLEKKERHKASPFGFSLSSKDFSARQWSLLSAVGLQRFKFL